MNKKLLLSAPLACPGAISALRNHAAVLKPYFDTSLVPLEHLVFHQYGSHKSHRNFAYRVLKKIRAISVKKMLPYGDNIIFAGFGPIFDTIIRVLNKKGIRPSFIWCSTLGQLELTPGERKTFVRITNFLRQGRIRHLFLHRRLYESLGCFIQGVTFFPHTIDLKPYDNIKKKQLLGVNVDLFCRPRYGKNILNQILAFEMLNMSGNIHINFDTKKFCDIIEMITSKCITHAWMAIDDYYSFITAMDLSLQVTIGESFNYAVCERMAMGVPVLTTHDIYMIADDAMLAKYLCVSASDTPAEISKAMRFIINNPKLRQELSEISKKRIKQVAIENNEIVIEQLSKIFH
jgi:glycosyltransferase involved in cell wall biosynthesis